MKKNANCIETENHSEKKGFARNEKEFVKSQTYALLACLTE
jgi:hypothetical protein